MKRRKITSCIIGLILVVSVIASLVLMPYANFQPSYEFGALFNRILNKDNPEDVAFINSKTFSSQGTLFKTISAHGKKLKDVKSWNWYYEDVLTCTVMGMINGFDDGTFRANNNVTRAQFVQILYNYDKINYERDGIEFGPFTGTVYTDVPETAWYQQAAQYASWLYLFQWRYPKNEYGEMIPGGEFGGNEKMTREELATVLWSYGSEFGSDKAREELSRFSDYEDVSEFAVRAMWWMTKNGVINGYPDGTLRPQNYVTRAEAAAILMRYFRNFRVISINGNFVSPVPTLDPEVLNGHKNGNGSTKASSVNAKHDVRKNAAYPTIGQADVANANGYYTKADVDIEGSVLCYEALDYLNEALNNFLEGRNAKYRVTWSWTTSDEFEEYALMRAKEAYYYHEKHKNDSGYEFRDAHIRSTDGDADEDGGLLLAENLCWDSISSLREYKGVVNSWINSPGHLALLCSGNGECIIANYKNMWVFCAVGTTESEYLYVYPEFNYHTGYISPADVAAGKTNPIYEARQAFRGVYGAPNDGTLKFLYNGLIQDTRRGEFLILWEYDL